MKEAKTVLIGSIRNEGKLVRKDPHQSLFSKVKKSLFSNPKKKIQMCFKSKSLAFGRRLEATGPRTNSLFQSKCCTRLMSVKYAVHCSLQINQIHYYVSIAMSISI